MLLKVELITKKIRGKEGWLAPALKVELIAKKIRGKEGWLAPALKVELITKKTRGKEGWLAPALKVELIAKKIRGKEGWLAPARSQCVPSPSISTSMTCGSTKLSLLKGGGKPPFLTSNLLRNELALKGRGQAG